MITHKHTCDACGRVDESEQPAMYYVVVGKWALGDVCERCLQLFQQNPRIVLAAIGAALKELSS